MVIIILVYHTQGVGIDWRIKFTSPLVYLRAFIHDSELINELTYFTIIIVDFIFTGDSMYVVVIA